MATKKRSRSNTIPRPLTAKQKASLAVAEEAAANPDQEYDYQLSGIPTEGPQREPTRMEMLTAQLCEAHEETKRAQERVDAAKQRLEDLQLEYVQAELRVERVHAELKVELEHG